MIFIFVSPITLLLKSSTKIMMKNVIYGLVGLYYISYYVDTLLLEEVQRMKF